MSDTRLLDPTIFQGGFYPPVVRIRGGRLIASFAALLCAIGILGYVGIRLGADGNYDLRNYHYYAGWALLHKHVGFDLAPAQVQSFQHPLHDALFYLASLPFNDRPLLFTFM